MGIALLYGVLNSGYSGLLGITSRNIIVQSIAIVIGIVGALILSKIDYHFLKKAWIIHVPLSYILVLLTFVIGIGAPLRPDDKRWLVIPFINFWFQPSELLKISFILAFAYHITQCKDNMNKPLNMLMLCLHALVPVGVIVLQGDMGTGMLMFAVALVMLFMAGVNWKNITIGLVSIAAAIPLLWQAIGPWRRSRIIAIFVREDADVLGDYYQQYQSKLAISVGELTGIGLTSRNHIYVPEMHTDFVFSFLCSAFGFLGAFFILSVMTGISLTILYRAITSKDSYGSLLCAGVFAVITFQYVINVGMCLSILPVIGNPFPFLSYGGSSAMTTYFGIGLVLSVYMNRKRGSLWD